METRQTQRNAREGNNKYQEKTEVTERCRQSSVPLFLPLIRTFFPLMQEFVPHCYMRMTCFPYLSSYITSSLLSLLSVFLIPPPASTPRVPPLLRSRSTSSWWLGHSSLSENCTPSSSYCRVWPLQDWLGSQGWDPSRDSVYV